MSSLTPKPNSGLHPTADTSPLKFLQPLVAAGDAGRWAAPCVLKDMSTDFIALFDASTDFSPEWLLTKLAGDPKFGAGVVERYWDRWLPKTWVVEAAPASGEPELLSPGGFAIRATPGTIELYHMMPFSTFASDPESRGALRRSCMLLADVVGSARAIYTHELMPYGGAGLAEIERGLRAGVGLPAASFEELREAEYYGPRAWYIDTFADLRQTAWL